MLDRDIAVVDLRQQQRPVVRLGLEAQNAIRQARGQPELGPDGKPIAVEATERKSANGKKKSG